MIKRIVLTGAPGTGKTSIIEQLERRFTCHKEISREIISQQISINGNITPWDNLEAFSDCVIDKREKQFKSCTKGLHFFDRSIIDSIAYLEYGNLKLKSKWKKQALSNRYYKNVFITPPWKEIYRNDSERKETFEQATQIHKALINTYKNYNYNLIEVPCSSIPERVQFIIKHIE